MAWRRAGSGSRTPSRKPETATRPSASWRLATRVAVLGGTLDRDLQRADAPARHGDGRQVDPPHGAVGRDDAVGGEALRVSGDEAAEMLAPDLLLALDQQLDVDRQPPLGAQERLGDKDGDQNRALVVGRTPRVEAAVAHRRLEGRAQPALQRVGRL